MAASEVLNPKASADLIMRSAKDVEILPDGVEKTAKVIYDGLCSGRISPRMFKGSELHPSEANEEAIDWIFLIDTLNFCFWSGENTAGKIVPKWEVKYRGKVYTGYFAMCAAVNRAIDEGMKITDPRVFGSLTEDDVLRIFRSETTTSIPLLEQRVQNLREASRVLLDKYKGSFVNCVKCAEENAAKLLRTIVTDFPSYRDEGVFQGTHVSFWKRAQILVGDIWACFEGRGLGHFSDIESLTMFPDYRIPQVLLHFGAIKYTPELYALLQRDEVLESGSRQEMEIRGASIHAVELIKEKVRNLIENSKASGGSKKETLTSESINSIMIDHFLWEYRRENVEELDKLPYHKVRCIFY